MRNHRGFRLRKLQLARRCVQLGALGFLFLTPVLARYGNYLAARELDAKVERWSGTLPGTTLVAVDRLLRAVPGAERERAGRVQRDRERVLERARALRGSAWSAQIGPVSVTDPLAAAESAVASRAVPWVLLAGVLLPLLLTALLGRVFCAWVCPMGLLFEINDRLRRLLRWLEIRPRDVRFSRRTKYALLVVGLALTALFAVPVLGYVYPPALVGREVHDLVFAWFDRAEIGRFGPSLQGLTWMSLLLVAFAVFELLVSRRWWCRYVCPGGALYALIGWARPVRVRLRAERCTGCALCVAACPMGLNPMRNRMGLECDNCGACISSCGEDALGYGLGGPRQPELRPLRVPAAGRSRRVPQREDGRVTAHAA